MNRELKALAATVLLALGAPALAHHSFYAEFDSNKQVVLEGTVVEMEWKNPHSWLVVSIVNDQGEAEEWRVEGGSPNVLMRLGWTRDSLPTGTRVKVTGFQAKDGSHRASSRSLDFPDGRQMDLGGTRN
jgi:hypothetical protein